MTDIDGEVFQHVLYYPFGETWVEESSSKQRTPFLFTGKELDEETGLYYFGARYYDPRTSVWQSPDPILASYLMGRRSEGGVFKPVNLNLYGYVQQRPINAVDPNGEDYQGYYGVFPRLGRYANSDQIPNPILRGLNNASAEILNIPASIANLGADALLGTAELTAPYAGVVENYAMTTPQTRPGAVVAGGVRKLGNLATRLRSTASPQTLRTPDGRFAYDGGPAVRPTTAGTHGNTLGDQMTNLYARYDAEGNFQKWGITSGPIDARYTRTQLNGGFLEEVETGPRWQMAQRERYLVETRPGPMNNEPWAGAQLPLVPRAD